MPEIVSQPKLIALSLCSSIHSLQDKQELRIPGAPTGADAEQHSGELTARNFSDKISYAFQLATAQGPLCHEPVQGIAVFLEDVTVASASEDESSSKAVLGQLTGEVIKSVRDSIRQGFLDWSPRLLLAMYSCEIQASSK